MNVSIFVPPYMEPKAFGEVVGSTKIAVSEQLQNDQLPRFILPMSSRQKDRGTTSRQRVYVDTLSLYLQRFDEVGVHLVKDW